MPRNGAPPMQTVSWQIGFRHADRRKGGRLPAMVHKPLLPHAESAARAQQIIFSPLSRARNAWNRMTAIHSSPATLLSRLAQSGGPSGVLHTRQRETGFTAGPATLFASSAFGLRAAQLNALADEPEGLF